MSASPAAPTRAIVYLRQSKDAEGTGDAVDRQLDACRALIEARGWHETRVFTDIDVSATRASPVRSTEPCSPRSPPAPSTPSSAGTLTASSAR